ncbi:MAG: hypothetical protein JWO44_2719 [Bacteroidetes bacterium]|jgi:hypothetical protein|nr:hypothetical protein [Bacteroidota bacterium]
MKKHILSISFLLGASALFAQDLTSKKGEPILPEADDWAISMNADPIFEFIGNAFNGNTKNNAANTNWLSASHTIVGKRFINEKTAYRVMLRIGFVNQTFKNMVANDAEFGTVFNFPDKQGQVEDKYRHSNMNLCIGAGKEWRKGKTRLQGYYGADLMIWMGSSKDKFTYGNQMSPTSNASAGGGSTTTMPTTTVWFTNPDSANFGMPDSVGARTSRLMQNKSGMTFGIGVRGFIGVEYFVFPKIAIGAEYGLGLGYQMTGKGRTEVQTQGGSPLQVANVDYEVAGSSKFGFDTDMNQGKIFGFSNAGTASLKITFHF